MAELLSIILKLFRAKNKSAKVKLDVKKSGEQHHCGEQCAVVNYSFITVEIETGERAIYQIYPVTKFVLKTMTKINGFNSIHQEKWRID